MKNFGLIFLIFTLVILSGGNSAYSQKKSAEVAKDVSTAIRNGNAREIAKYFGSNVDLNFPGNEGTFSRNQAELILRNFFQRNAPASFSVQHEGASRDGSPYVIGNYRSKNGDTYRVYFLIKNISGNTVLHLLQFEKQ